jgi:hypothetical protein
MSNEQQFEIDKVWETQEVSKENEHIRAAKYPDLMTYHEALAGKGPLAYMWQDKPHRLIFDLTGLIAQMRDELSQSSKIMEADDLARAKLRAEGLNGPGLLLAELFGDPKVKKQ